LTAVLQALGEARHRLQVLKEKAASQPAYVSIFGPLKSGKSTRMNAISGTYVSDITSLPAYPRVAPARDAEAPQITITRYDGHQQVCVDSQQMQDTLQRAHQTLAEEIRQAEENGEDFNPAVHDPAAIRRVDIGIPAPSLRASQTVLV